MKRIAIEREAAEDLREACEWYENQRIGLSHDFILCVEAAIEIAATTPRSFPFVHSMTQRVLVKRFPYIVLFRDLPDQILVLGVFHASRDPDRIRRRSK